MLYILPDSAGDILVVQASDNLTQSDYHDIFLPQIKKQLKPSHSLRVLLYLDHNLQSIEDNSNWRSEALFNQSEADIIRMAVVSDKKWQHWSDSLNSDLVKHFSVSEFLTALHWSDEGHI